MKTMRLYLQMTALFTLLLGGTMLSGCGEDDPVTPPDFGESSITFLHANPGRSSGVAFFRGDTTRIGTGTTAYGQFFTATTPNNPSVKYSVKATDGTTLRSVTGSQDSAKRTMVIYTGSATTDSLFMASSTKINAGTNATVRFIHAAQGASGRDLRIGDPTGPAIATNLGYKGANGSYISVPTTTQTLWIVDPSDTTHNVAVPTGNLMAGQSYSVVFTGVENPVSAEFGWMGLLIADPN